MLSGKSGKSLSKIYITYILAVTIWNALIFFTPYLASIDHPLYYLLYKFFSYTCHQDPSRSLFLFGNQLPVCARDTAIYLGMLIGGLALPLFADTTSKKVPPVLFLIIAMIPIGIDGITQLLGWRESINTIRIITGGIIGLVIPFYLIPILNFFKYKFSRNKK